MSSGIEVEEVLPERLWRRNRVSRTQGAGLFARRQAERISREELVRRARLLPALPQALLVAHYDLGLTLDDLALLHQMPRQRLYRLLVRWRDTLSDRAFLLAAHFADRLRPRQAELARDYWIEGRTLRELAVARQATLHEIRTRLAEARVSLLEAANQMRQAHEMPLV